MGKKIIDFATQCDTSRGRKSKAGGGGKKSKAVQLYTPLVFYANKIFHDENSFQNKNCFYDINAFMI